MTVGMEDPLALGQSRSSSAQKLKHSAGSLLNKWGERAHFLSSFSLHSFFLPFFVRRDHRNAKRSRDAVCLITLSAEEWLLWMGTVVTWPCCSISLKQKNLQIHAQHRSGYHCYWISWYNGTSWVQVFTFIEDTLWVKAFLFHECHNLKKEQFNYHCLL